jgi:hypothetical protein
MSNKLPFLSDEFHFAIASVAVRAAQLEHHIEHAISHFMIKSPEMSKFLLGKASQGKSVEAFRAAAIDALPDMAAQIDELVKRIVKIKDRRNETLHWLWGKGEDENNAKTANIKPHKDHKIKMKTAKDVSKIADDALGAAIDIIQLQDIYYNRVVPSQDKLVSLLLPNNSASKETPGSP